MNEYEYESVRDWKESHTLDFSMGAALLLPARVGCKRQATATGDKLDVLLAWRADKTRGSNNYTDTLSKARKDPECGSK
jgi:hypothetical protein